MILPKSSRMVTSRPGSVRTTAWPPSSFSRSSRPLHRIRRRLDQRLLVGAAVERQVGVGDQAARSRRCARPRPCGVLQHRDAARHQRRERPRLQAAVGRLRPRRRRRPAAAPSSQPASSKPTSVQPSGSAAASKSSMKPSEWFDCGVSWVQACDWMQRQPSCGRERRPRRPASRRALGPEAAVAEGRLPHALGGLVEGGVAAVGVDQHRDDVVAGRQRAGQVVVVVALEERAAAHRPAALRAPLT